MYRDFESLEALEDHIIAVLNSDRPILNLASQALDDSTMVVIGKLILSPKVRFTCPAVLNFSNTCRFLGADDHNSLYSDSVDSIALLLKSRKLPTGSTLDLSYTGIISDLRLFKLALALKAQHCSRGLNIILKRCRIQDSHATVLMKLFTSGKLAYGTSIDFSGNTLSPAIIDQLQQARNPQGLDAGKLCFGDAGFIYENPSRLTLILDKIQQGLHHGKSHHWYVDLKHQKIDDAGTMAITHAIRDNQPLNLKALTLDLRDNNISDIGAIALAEMLRHCKELTC